MMPTLNILLLSAMQAFSPSRSVLLVVLASTVAAPLLPQPVFVKPVFVAGVLKLVSSPLSIRGENVATKFAPRFPLQREVVRIDGIDVASWLLRWARDNLGWTNDPSGSFNAAVARLQAAVRPLATGGMPTSQSLVYTVLDAAGQEAEYTVPWQFLVTGATNNASEFARECQRTSPPESINCTEPVPPSGTSAPGRRLGAAHEDAVASALARLHAMATAPTPQSRAAAREASVLKAGQAPSAAVEAATLESLKQLHASGQSLDAITATAVRHTRVLRQHGGRPHMITSESAGQARGLDAVSTFNIKSGLQEPPRKLAQGSTVSIALEAGRGRLGGRGLGDVAAEEGDVIVTTIFDKSSTLGLTLRHYEDELTGSNADMLSISTFNPPLVSACFAEILSTPCPTPAQEAAADACYSAGLNAFLVAGSLDVLQHVQSTGSSLILDLVGNGGGNVVLGQLLLVSLFTDLAANPMLASPAYDFHQDQLQAAMGEFSVAAGKALPGYAFNGLLLRSNGQSVSNAATGAMQNITWYSPGTQVARGARPLEPYSQEVMLVDLAAMLSGQLPPDVLTPERTMLVTDLQCGSMCGQFSHMLVEAGLGKVLGLGGVPWLGSDATAFTGGYIISDAESITRTYEAAVQAGFSIAPGSGIVPPTYFPTSAGFSMNFGAMVSTLHPPFHAQMVALKPSARLMEWTQGFMTLEQSALAARLEAVVPLTPLSADSRVGQYVLVKTNSSKAATALAVAMSILFAIAAVAVCVLGYMLYKARQPKALEVREAYPSLSRRDDSTGSGQGWSHAGGRTVAQLA